MIVDRDKALEMIEDNPENFKMCSKEIKNDPNFFDQAMGVLGRECNYYVSDAISDLIQNAGEGITNNEKYIGHLLDEMNMDDLKYVSLKLKNNENFMLKAIKTDGTAILYASDNLRNNKSFIIKAIKLNSVAFKFLSEEERSNTQIIDVVVKQNPEMFKYIGSNLYDSISFALKMIQDEPNVLGYVNDKFRSKLILELVRADGRMFKYANARDKSDEKLVVAAIDNSRGIAYEYADERLKKSPEFCRLVIKTLGDDMERLYNGIYKQIINTANLDDERKRVKNEVKTLTKKS